MNSSLASKISKVQPKQSQNRIQIGDYSYNPSQFLGCGNSSSVFLGKNIQKNEQVAIKVTQTKRISSTIQKVLFQNEKKVIDRLICRQINGVTKYIQILESKTHIYMAMQKCEGDDLQKLIKKNKMEEKVVKKYVFDLVTSLIELNQNKIVHRDLKPANILLNTQGQLKIADFGFSVIQEEDSKKYNYCVGSPVYCSPQALQQFTYGIKSDLWALGIVVYKMLTGQTPWKGKNNKDLVDKIRKIPISSLIQGIKDPILLKFLQGCLEIDATKRFGLHELKQAIKQIQNEFGCKKKVADQFHCKSNADSSTQSLVQSRLKSKPIKKRANTISLKKSNLDSKSKKQCSKNDLNTEYSINASGSLIIFTQEQIKA